MYNKFKRHKQVRLMRLSFERYFSYHLRIKSRNVVSFNILAHGVLITSSCPWLWTLLWTLNRQAKIFLRKEHGFLYIQKTINLQVICGAIKLLRSHKITKISTPPPPPPRSHLLDFGNPLPPANVQNFTSPPLSTTIINQYLNRAIL